MKKVEVLLHIALLSVSMLPLGGVADASVATTDVLVTEMQTSNTNASEEFIELYNTTDHDIDFADRAHQGRDIWKIQFFSSTRIGGSFNWDPKTSGLTTISLVRSDNLPVIIQSHNYFLISTMSNGVAYAPGGVEPDFTYTSGHMSDSGGGIQLVDTVGAGAAAVITAHDHIGWFRPTASTPLPEGFYLSPAAGTSLQRTVTQDGSSYVASDGSLQPYVQTPNISPRETWAPAVDIDSITTESQATAGAELQPVMNDGTSAPAASGGTDAGQAALDTTESQQVLQPVHINELLPNPAAPQSDDTDEYVELFNPNNQAIDLSGYSIQTGLKFAYSYTFHGVTIAPTGYLKVTSGDTKLSLANSGGQARLLDTGGGVTSQTAIYTKAPAGESWAWADGQWQWSTSPTPGSANLISASPPPTVVASETSDPPAYRTGVPKPKPNPKPKVSSGTSKSSAPKATKPTKAVKPKKPAISAAAQAAADAANRPTTLHTAILVGVGLVTVLYGAYEYRADMGNRLHQLRSHRATRRATRKTPQGARSD